MTSMKGPSKNNWAVQPIGRHFYCPTGTIGKTQDRRQVPFLSMDRLPVSRLEVNSYEIRSAGEIASGTAFDEGDLLVAKITPCFENGRQAIARAVPGGQGVATTE